MASKTSITSKTSKTSMASKASKASMASMASKASMASMASKASMAESKYVDLSVRSLPLPSPRLKYAEVAGNRTLS